MMARPWANMRSNIVTAPEINLPAPEPFERESAVALYEAACQALADAQTLIEVKDIRDKAKAIAEYGRLARDQTLHIRAKELMIRAERKLGFMLAETPRNAGGRPSETRSNKEQVLPPALEEMGIDRKLSSRAQKLASISERAIEARLSSWRERVEREGGRITTDLMRDGDKRERRAEREARLGAGQAAGNLALPQKKYGVILADPEWRFEPYSRDTGMDRAADNHYPTSTTDVIASRDVASIAADDCVLFLWATAPMLPQALLVMAAWGFEYKSHYIWAKDRIGTGYWNRNAHELLLVGVKGSIPAPAPGTQRPSVIEGRVTRHSAKPEVFLEMIEDYFPTLPKIELNRRGPARPGWQPWGNEAQAAPEAAE